MWTFNLGNYNDYRKELNETDWEPCFNLNTFEDICRVWTDTLLNIAKKHVPNKIVTRMLLLQATVKRFQFDLYVNLEGQQMLISSWFQQ